MTELGLTMEGMVATLQTGESWSTEFAGMMEAVESALGEGVSLSQLPGEVVTLFDAAWPALVAV